MSTRPVDEFEVAVIGAGVVGCATAMGLARRGVSTALLEAEREPGLAASGTNSGVLHTGFDSPPEELETELILRSAQLRDQALDALRVPVLRCGALMIPADPDQRATVREIAELARGNGVEVSERADGVLEIPAEAVTNPVAYTLALVEAGRRHGARLQTRWPVAAIERRSSSLVLGSSAGERLSCRYAVNCAGLRADAVARMVGDDSFEIYPRKGEFLVFAAPEAELPQIRLPIPTKRTKGVLVFPTTDGHVVAGPTAIDQTDKNDWSVRAAAREEILPKAVGMYPPLDGCEPVAAYAGLRPAGRGVNYVIGASPACPALVNVAAIRSTGLTASLGIAERVAEILVGLGLRLHPEAPLGRAEGDPSQSGPWWRRTAEYRAS